MKKIFLVLAIFGMLQTTFAQKKKNSRTTSQKTHSKKSSTSEAINDGDVLANAGIGVIGLGIPIYAGVDYGIGNDITIGVEASYQKWKDTFLINDFESTIIGIGATGNYHFGRILKTPKQWDLYMGVGFGYIIWTFDNKNAFNNDNYLSDKSSGIVLGGQIGARYFVGKKFALNFQLGGITALSIFKIGATYKF